MSDHAGGDGVTVVLASGCIDALSEYAVQAHLDSWTEHRSVDAGSFGRPQVRDDLPAWGGTIQAHGEQEAFAIHDADDLVLGVDSGQEQMFIVDDGGDLAAGILRITGNDGPPFDD